MKMHEDERKFEQKHNAYLRTKWSLVKFLETKNNDPTDRPFRTTAILW